MIQVLHHTKDYSLKYEKTVDNPELVGFSDANWAQDICHSRSRSGGLTQFGGMTVMVQSKLMSLICLSTAESEWQSAHLIARELELQRYLLNFMGWNISYLVCHFVDRFPKLHRHVFVIGWC